MKNRTKNLAQADAKVVETRIEQHELTIKRKELDLFR